MPNRQREITLRFLAEPTDINYGGKVHGGTVMKWIDQAAYACAANWSGHYCVTVYVGGIQFHRPILISNLVEVHAKLIYTGNTSMHITVDVSAGDPMEGTYTPTTSCITVFVALDNEGKPTKVPTWKPETEEDQALARYAEKLMEIRETIKREMPPAPTENTP